MAVMDGGDTVLVFTNDVVCAGHVVTTGLEMGAAYNSSYWNSAVIYISVSPIRCSNYTFTLWCTVYHISNVLMEYKYILRII